jgi:hypothetical protein
MQNANNNESSQIEIEKTDALCDHCGEPGHNESDCPEVEAFLERDERRRKEFRYAMKMRRNQEFPIKYACNPAAYYASLSEEIQNKIDIRQAQLYCMTCSSRADITSKNISTLPESLIADRYKKTVFDHIPIYGGQCLRPDCKG